MKKILCLLIALILFVPCAFADRVSRTTAIYTTSGLIKRGDARVYRVEFIATSNGGGFNIKDAITGETASKIDDILKYFDESRVEVTYEIGRNRFVLLYQ